MFVWLFLRNKKKKERKGFINKPDDIRPLERVDVIFDFARSKTFTINFINILLKKIIVMY